MENIHFLTFDLYLGAKVTQDTVQYPLNHETYPSAKYGVAVSNGLGDVFTRKYIRPNKKICVVQVTS